MNRTLRNGALALLLAGGAMLASAPAKANSIHDEGYFGGTWTSIGCQAPQWRPYRPPL